MFLNETDSQEEKPWLLRAVESLVAGPKDIRETVETCRQKVVRKSPELHARDLQIKTAEEIIARYARTCGRVGSVTSLAGVVPGVGTLVSLVGATAADLAITMKYQIEMVMALAHLFGRDITDEEERRLCYSVAGLGVATQAGLLSFQNFTVNGLSAAAKRLMKGRAKRWMIDLFKKIGLRFTERGVLKAIPVGVGVVLSYSSNKRLTRYVGRRARDYFISTQ